jgi:hypothetical protein
MNKLKVLLGFLILFIVPSVFGQGFAYTVNPPMPNDTLSVCVWNGPPMPSTVCTNYTNIYTTAALSSTISQPVALGAGGTQTFYTAAGTFLLQFSSSGTIVQQFLLAMGGGVPGISQGTGGGGSGSGIPYGTGGGTAQAQTVTTTPNITSLTDGQIVSWKPSNSNTASMPTLNVDGLGAISVTDFGVAPIYPGDILSSVPAVAIYNSSANVWTLQNPQTAAFGGLPVSAGTANAQTLTLNPALVSYHSGTIFNFVPGLANTGAMNIAISGLATRNITKCGTTALVANDLTTTAIAVLLDDGTELQLLNPQATGCGAAAATTLTSYAVQGYTGNTFAFANTGNDIYLYADTGPSVPTQISTVAFRVTTLDASNNVSVGLYGPCAPGSSACPIVCSTTAATYASTGDKNVACSQGTVTFNPAGAGQFYYISTTGVTSTAQYATSDGAITAYCSNAVPTSSAGALPATLNIPAASWGRCNSRPAVAFHN